MNSTPSPQKLNADDAIAAYESAIPLLLKILPDMCGSSCLIREIVWSIYNNRPVGLSKVACLDQDRKDAVLALLNLRMDLGGNSDSYIHELLEESGEFGRREEAEALAKELGVPFRIYPLTDDELRVRNQAIDRRNAFKPDY